MALRYINSVLNLFVAGEIMPLARFMATRGMSCIVVERKGEPKGWSARVEVDEYYDDPETTIGAMLATIEGVDASASTVWGDCSLREFNVVYQCGTEPEAIEGRFSSELLARIVGVGASIAVTIEKCPGNAS